MKMEEGIVQPVKGKSAPDLGPWAVLAATHTDLTELCRLMDRRPEEGRWLFNSRIHLRDRAPALVGPMVGAPYAAMILETLIAWGASRFIFYGWCGAVSEAVEIGDILVPRSAWIDEGTSRHYPAPGGADPRRVEPTPAGVATVRGALEGVEADYVEGSVWTTDAIFRETPSQVDRYRQKGALAVEMEISALFSVARFRKVEIGAVVVVSDEISGMTWRRGFRDARFADARRGVCRGIEKRCRKISATV